MKKGFKTSRRSFIVNYFLGVGLLLYLFLTDAILILSSWLIVFFLILISLFFIEPEFVLVYTTYYLKEDNVMEVKGIFAKKRIAIPYSSISNIGMNKDVIGRIFGYGNVLVNSFSGGNKITLKGIKDPEKTFKLIEKRIQER